MLKIKMFILQNKEKAILSAISFLLALNSLFFVAREVKLISFLKVSSNTDSFYLAYLILGCLSFGSIAFFNRRIFTYENFGKILAVFLPTTLILTSGLFQSKKFHYVFTLAVGLYYFASGFYLIGKRSFEWKSQKVGFVPFTKNWLKSQGKIAIFIVLAVMMTNLSFGLFHLEKFGAVDEPLWTFDRIPKYWKNIAERDWNGTRISDKPGITVSLISGTGLLFENPKPYKSFYKKGLIDSSPYDFEKLNFIFRFPIFLFTVLMLPFFYFLVERLAGKPSAIFSTILIGLSPLLIGMATIINPDSILWIFAPLSLISFMVFQKRRTVHYLYASGIFLGLALLTKYVSNILSIFFIVLIFTEYIFDREKYKDVTVAKYIKESLLDYLILTFVALATFYALFPGVWVKPSRLLTATLFSQAFSSTWPMFAALIGLIVADMIALKSKVASIMLTFLGRYGRFLIISIISIFLFFVFLAAANTYLGMKWYDFEAIISSPKSAYSAGGYDGLFVANFFPLIFTITPTTLISLLLASAWIVVFVVKHKNLDRTSSTFTVITLFILLYYLATTVNKVAAMNRYQIMVFPLAMILGGIGLGLLYSNLSRKSKQWHYVAFLLVFLISAYSLNASKPFYLSYDSPLLPKKYYTDLKDMGTGSYEAAQLINSLPNPENLNVWTDKQGVCPFLKAKCLSGFTYKNLRSAGIDYAIVSAGRESRTKKMVNPNSFKEGLIRLDTLYDRNDENVVYKLEINGRPRNYIKVIRIDEQFMSL